MAEQIISGGIGAPGFAGLNLQDSSVQLNTGFALEAFNCVIDKYGRIGARKGWDNVNSTVLGAGGAVRTIHEFVKADGNLTFAAANNAIYGTHPITGEYLQYPIGGTQFYTGTYSQTGLEVTVTTVENHGLTVGATVWFDATSGTATDGFYTVTYTDAAKVFRFNNTTSHTTSGTCLGINILTTYSITDDNWQVASMPLGTGLTASAHAVWVQEDHIPLVIHKLGTAAHSHADGYGFQRLGDVATALPLGYTTDTFKPACALYAFGRLWVANTNANDTQTVYFSDLQNPGQWQTGTSGKLDISAVVPTGDPIVALAQHNNFLVIFCRKHIVIYENPAVPASLTLSDTIKGIGCIARDSVASVAGTDLLFLSDTGVQSLGRLVSEKSLPFRDISKNVRDELMTAVNSEQAKNIKGVYYGSDAFYLLALPSTGFTYCFDTRGQLENGAARTTIWKDINPTAFHVTYNRQLYLGEEGYVGRYTGYSDNGSSYRWSYYTNYFDFDKPNALKILKKIGFVAIGGGNQVVSLKWSFDYSDNSYGGTVQLAAQTVYEYGTAEYAIATYANGISLDVKKFNASGTGRVLQLGFESEIDGYPLSIQKVDFMLKEGKQV